MAIMTDEKRPPRRRWRLLWMIGLALGAAVVSAGANSIAVHDNREFFPLIFGLAVFLVDLVVLHIGPLMRVPIVTGIISGMVCVILYLVLSLASPGTPGYLFLLVPVLILWFCVLDPTFGGWILLCIISNIVVMMLARRIDTGPATPAATHPPQAVAG